jgi:hypothetical protein
MDSLRKKDIPLRKLILPFLILVPLFVSCSSSKPPEEIFHDNIEKMILLDRAMGFKGEVTSVSIVSMTVYEDQVEVEVRVEGWTSHRDLVIGATLPASKVKKPGWATWKFFTAKEGENWVIKEKFKVAEGFEER